MSKPKIDLSLMKRLVGELESVLNTAEGMSTDVKADKNEWILEMSKAIGLASGILTEAGLLMGDIQHLIQGHAPGTASKQDFLEKLLGGIKGPGNTN